MTTRSAHILSRPIQMYVRQVMILFATAYALLNGSVLNAQVVNDNCSTATDLGLLQFEQTCTFNNANGVPTVYPFSDSTTFAVPEFPYPAMPLTCEGYAPAVTTPSNDMWYTFQAGCYFSIEVEPGSNYTTDTVHLSLWTGWGCGQLTPVKCYTLAANTSLNDSLIPYYDGPYYLQVSSPSLTAISRFAICLRAHSFPCAPSVFSNGEETPVLCFPYELNLVNTQEVGGMGSASIILDELYGPYAITWGDGITDALSRTDLPVGDQTVTITNSAGCTVMIPYTIALDPVRRSVSTQIDLPHFTTPIRSCIFNSAQWIAYQCK